MNDCVLNLLRDYLFSFLFSRPGWALRAIFANYVRHFDHNVGTQYSFNFRQVLLQHLENNVTIEIRLIVTLELIHVQCVEHCKCYHKTRMLIRTRR